MNGGKRKGRNKMASREDFFNQIANRLGRERLRDVKSPIYPDQPWEHLYKEYSHEDYVALFTENLTSLSGDVIRVTSDDQLKAAIIKMIEDEGAETALLWKDYRLEEIGLKEKLLAVGLKIKEWEATIDKQELMDFAEQADLGFTFAEMGLAETGTILLYNQGDQGRSVSLLPKVSITFLYTTDIYPRITSALKQIHEKHEKEGLPSLINFITGPSRSADIEMSLSIGVHGPGKVYVILID